MKLASAKTVTSVSIRLPKDATFTLASMHDVQVKVGNQQPVPGASVQNINTSCAVRDWQLARKKGDKVTFVCGTPLAGQFITIQIKSKEHARDVLSIAEVEIRGY